MPPLFADADANLLTVLMAGLATVGGIASSVLNFFQYRSKLQFDAKVVKLEADHENLTGRVAECETDRAKLAKRVVHLETLMDDSDPGDSDTVDLD